MNSINSPQQSHVTRMISALLIGFTLCLLRDATSALPLASASASTIVAQGTPAITIIPLTASSSSSFSSSSSASVSSTNAGTSLNSNPSKTTLTTAGSPTVTPPAVIDILKDRIFQLRSGVTGEKVGQLRVGESLVTRLKDIDYELDTLQTDIFRIQADWDVLSVYPNIFRAFSPLLTAYTDRAFPTTSEVIRSLVCYDMI